MAVSGFILLLFILADLDHAKRRRVLRQEYRKTLRGKQEFLETVSHELRSPLHGIVNGIHLLRSNEEFRPTEDQGQERVLNLSDSFN